ncbi:MAG: UDP-N-acetylglucosamine 1-carboxyvinyltransferase [Candidatus Sungbacteria bacterium]|nr:UDP-N-acetylglucosamine 1-carboxyvinyltransferase [Candidatus Sungbacteria bacterium]
MQKFIIEGGHPLEGEVIIGGSKNAALPLIAASLLTEEPVLLENIPAISDVAAMAKIAEGLGAHIEFNAEKSAIRITAAALSNPSVDEALTRKLRGSVLFSGALVGRMRNAILPYPGGDVIGARPLATHLHALEGLGCVIYEDGNNLRIDGASLHGGEIVLEEQSVTATENTILAAVLVPGETIITLAAFEPHVQELVAFLNKMGADIQWIDFSRLMIRGVKRLNGITHRINPDEIEISSFAALAGATRSRIFLRNVEPKYLDAIFLQLRKMGVSYTISGNGPLATLGIEKPPAVYKSFRIQSGFYPKLVTDHIPPFAVLATQAHGTSLIHDWMYENRLRYIPELQKMGAHCTILDPHRALITGPSSLRGSEIETYDIRSGMTLVIAGLTAEGRSTISNIEHIDRGYEKIDQRLRALGANIERINE